jgi:hypothetical protein
MVTRAPHLALHIGRLTGRHATMIPCPSTSRACPTATITIAQLLEMRSGLYNYTNDAIISATIDTDPAKVWTPAELLAIAFAL